MSYIDDWDCSEALGEINNMDKLAAFVVELFQGLKSSARWIAIIFTFIAIGVVFYGYERSTGQLYFSRLDRKITLLKELYELKNSGIEQYPELYAIYQDAVDELTEFKIVRSQNIQLRPIDWRNPETIWKAVSGSFVWLLILIFGVSSEIGKIGKITGFILLLVVTLFLIAILFAWFGAAIPTIFNPWINYILLPVLQIAALVYFSTKAEKKPVHQTPITE